MLYSNYRKHLVLLTLSCRHLDAVFLFIGPYSAVPPPQGAQTKKGLANKAAAKKAESSDSSDSSDEAEQVPSKAEAGRL